jgi:hypothetical protein
VESSEAFVQMSREPLEFRSEGLFSEFDGILEPLTHPGLLLLVDLRVQAHEVRRRLDGWIRDFQIEQAVERAGVIAGVEERAKSPLCF